MSSVSSFPFVLIASSWASFGFDSGRTLFLFSLSVLSLQSEVGFLFAVCLNLSLFLYLFFGMFAVRFNGFMGG